MAYVEKLAPDKIGVYIDMKETITTSFPRREDFVYLAELKLELDEAIDLQEKLNNVITEMRQHGES